MTSLLETLTDELNRAIPRIIAEQQAFEEKCRKPLAQRATEYLAEALENWEHKRPEFDGDVKDPATQIGKIYNDLITKIHHDVSCCNVSSMQKFRIEGEDGSPERKLFVDMVFYVITKLRSEGLYAAVTTVYGKYIVVSVAGWHPIRPTKDCQYSHPDEYVMSGIYKGYFESLGYNWLE